jgi:hypothetical protein
VRTQHSSPLEDVARHSLGSKEIQPSLTRDFMGFPASKTMRNKFLFLINYPISDILL